MDLSNASFLSLVKLCMQSYRQVYLGCVYLKFSIEGPISFLFFPTFNSLPVFDLRKCQEQNAQSEEKGKEHTSSNRWSAL